LSGFATNFTGSVLNDSATRSFGGTFTGTGVQFGSFTLGVTTLENGGSGLTGETAYSDVTVDYSANVIYKRSFSPATDNPISRGRCLITGTPTGGTVVTSLGLHAVTADATLGTFSSVNGLSLSTADSLVFNGGVASQSATYAVSGTATTAGAFSGT